MNGLISNSYDALNADFQEIVGKSVEDWVITDYFSHHIKQYRKRPIVWQIQSKPSNRGENPAFSCLILYNQINEDTLPKIRNQYLGPLLTTYRTEYTTLQEYGKLSSEQNGRRVKLQNIIEELEDFDEKLLTTILNGFDSDKLRVLSDNETLDKWTSETRKAPKPSRFEELILQEKMYNPDINDGVRVNIAPLQKYGLLASKVLSKKDIERAIIDRAVWRFQERNWSRNGKLPQPGYWK